MGENIILSFPHSIIRQEYSEMNVLTFQSDDGIFITDVITGENDAHPFVPVDAERRSQNVNCRSTFVPFDGRFRFQGTQSRKTLETHFFDQLFGTCD